jgi:hypothetical protein
MEGGRKGGEIRLSLVWIFNLIASKTAAPM